MSPMTVVNRLKKCGQFKIKMSAVFIALFLSLSLYFGVGSYNGYCFSQGRMLSNAEKIDLAVEDFLKRQSAMQHMQSGDQKFIPYANKEEFFRLNPDCCSISKEIPVEGTTRLNFADRLFGYSSDFVVIEYRSRFQGVSGKMETKEIKTYPKVSNCGVVH